MDPLSIIAAVVGVADVAGRTSNSIWRLCDAGRDAPRDVHELRDELTRASEFFSGLERGLTTERQRGAATQGWSPELTRGLDELFRQATVDHDRDT